jgi:hypothetical protein
VLHVAHGDHLDVVGQYGARGEVNGADGGASSWGGDWIPSASGFDAAAFAAVWFDVAEFIANASNQIQKPK